MLTIRHDALYDCIAVEVPKYFEKRFLYNSVYLWGMIGNIALPQHVTEGKHYSAYTSE